MVCRRVEVVDEAHEKETEVRRERIRQWERMSECVAVSMVEDYSVEQALVGRYDTEDGMSKTGQDKKRSRQTREAQVHWARLVIQPGREMGDGALLPAR